MVSVVQNLSKIKTKWMSLPSLKGAIFVRLVGMGLLLE